jgi:4-amino-4-deoxy-L-arabinose transferase-like glycosyltransferase
MPEGATPGTDSPPAAPAKGKGPRTTHSSTYKAPELISAADTVMLPKLKPGQGAPGGATKKKSASASATGTDSAPVVLEDQPTTIMPVQTMPRRNADPAPPEQPYRPPQRRKWISRGVLLAILLTQAVLSLRLRNTAFEDEAQYLYAGRLEIAHLFHGAPLPINFASYFSGSPVLYPVLGAAANNAGGLAAARAVSLVEMLATTALLYAISRRLFNERVAICAALLYSVAASVTYLGNFATFDASCLFLLALAAWIMVRTAVSRWPLFLLAAPVAALAVATKYAGLLFVPTIAVLPVLTAWPYHRRRIFAYPVIFGVAVAALLYGAVKWGGHSYIQALQQTTTSRAQGTTPLSQILWESLKWGGLQFGAAVLGTIAYTWRPRTDEDEDISPAGSRLRRILLGLVLTGTALLAPAYQAHLHTDVSFHKHIGFGLFFAAPMAGVGLARIVGDHFRRPQLGIAVWGVAILLGMTQSAILFGGWGNSAGLVKVLGRQLKPGARYLVEVPEVPTYYLQGRPGARATQFYSTFVIFYVDPQGQTLTGDAGFEVAIKNGFFQVIAYEGTITPAVDNILASELKKSSLYRLASVVPDNTADHTGSYFVWVKKTASTAGTGKVTSKAGT